MQKKLFTRFWYRKRKITLFLFLFCSLQSYVFAYSQAKVSFNFENITVEQALKQIKKESGYGIFYKSSDLKDLNKINVRIKDASVEETLSEVLEDTGLSYSIKEGVIVIQKAKKEETKPTTQVSAMADDKRDVKGTVKDETGELLIGVSVSVKNTTKGSITDIDGAFKITDVAENALLVFTYLGYQTMEIPINKQTNISVVMKMAATQLDETVIVGYSTRKKSTLTGSIKALEGEKIAGKPVASFDQAIQGQIAGVYSMSSGVPGGSSKIMIRGVPTADANGSVPLYILDGVVISPTNFASINPNDIDQYTVLKDASATSIYGALAANGVVLLTSKRGRDMRPELSYRFQLGTSILADQNFKVMNTSQRLQYEEELGMRILDETGQYYITKDNNGNVISKESKQDLLDIDTDWVDEIFRNGTIQSHELSLRGGSENTKYYASINYYDQEGILPSSEFNRMGFRVNLDQKVTHALTVGISATMGKERRQDVITGNNSGALNTLNPIFASYALVPYLKPYNDDGELIDFTNGEFRNPLLFYSMSDFHVNQIKTVANIYAELQLSKQLKFKTVLGTNYQNQNGVTYISPKWNKNSTGDKGSMSRTYGDEQNTTNTNLLTYRNVFNKNHNLTVLFGEESLMSEDNSFTASSTGFSNDKIQMLTAATTPLPNIDAYSKWTTLSFFSQANYNYSNKYFLDMSIRRDGSSRFGDNNKWGTFWSVGASWNLKREKFLEDSKTISLLNLLGSTGTTGNSNVGTYDGYQTYSYNADYNGQIGSAPDKPANSELHWETVWKNNLGVDIMLYNKYRFKLEGYYNETTDMLFREPLSLTSGFTALVKNIGSMTNQGIEFEWDLTLLENKSYLWKFIGNATYNQAKMTKLNDVYDSGSWMMKEGERYGLYYLVRYAGVDPLKGTPLWYTADGKITDTYSEQDRVFLGKSFIPPFMGGFGTDFSYKEFGASIFFSWVAKKYMIDQTSNFYDSNGYWKTYNQGVDMLDYWKNPGDITPYPNPDSQSHQMDTRYLENASFLRLKNVTLYYNLNNDYVKTLKIIKSARLSLQAQNLLTITGYRGFDPEHMGVIESNIYPQSRSFTFGLDITF